MKRPDPPLGHDGPGLDTRTDARLARVPKTIPIKNSTACRLVRCDPIKPKGQAMAKVSTSTGRPSTLEINRDLCRWSGRNRSVRPKLAIGLLRIDDQARRVVIVHPDRFDY